MDINYHNRKFRAVSNSDSGEVEESTIFNYFQDGNILWGTYTGKHIQFGTITGLVHKDSHLEFSYQHVNADNEIMTGLCRSTPIELDNGKIQLRERWQWTCKDKTKGESIIEEI